MEGNPVREIPIPFSYSNTCGMGLDMFDACNCGRKSKPIMIEQLPTPEGTPLPEAGLVARSKKGAKSQAKPLLFINSDAKHLKSQATRSEVTSHLRSAYQPWKQRMQAKARKAAGGKLPVTQANTKTRRSSVESKDSTETKLNGGAAVFRLSAYGPLTQTPKPDLSSTTLSLAPSPLLLHGNSDPFSSLALPITPLIAELIRFEHAHLHPCIYSTKNTPSRSYGTSYLADMHGPAANQAAVYGYLSRAAIVLSSAGGGEKFARAALVLKGRSSVLLREELASTQAVGSGLERKILALMIAELFAHEYPAASVHSRVLMRLLEERAKRRGENFDMRFFFSVVYSEVQRSCMSLTRPCFDVRKNGWVARMFEDVGGAAFRDLVQTMDIDDRPLEPRVLGLELAAIFGEVRTVRKVSEEYSNSPVYGTPTPLALYLPARVVLCLGRMVNFYMEHCAGRGVEDLLPRELIHRAAVLGALYWVRKAGHIDSIRVSSTSTIYSAGPMILRKLRESLESFDRVAGHNEGELYAGLRFWVLYIGAQEEQGRVRKGEESGELWFTERLVDASLRVRVCTWQQARPILERYPHPDAAEPHGSTWFSGIFERWGLGLGDVFAGVAPLETMDDLGKVELGRGINGSGNDYMTWSTEQPMESDAVSVGSEERLCGMLKQSVKPPQRLQKSLTTFACPSWNIGQESYWASVSSSPDIDSENESEVNTTLNGSGAIIARYTTTATVSPPHRSKNTDPVTGWIGMQTQSRTSSTPSHPTRASYPGISLDVHTTTTVPLSAAESHLFHSSAPCWQGDCGVGGHGRGDGGKRAGWEEDWETWGETGMFGGSFKDRDLMAGEVRR